VKDFRGGELLFPNVFVKRPQEILSECSIWISKKVFYFVCLKKNVN
jgi:hypothetical protein